jgi:integrase
MAIRKPLTDKTLKALKAAPAGKRTEIFDTLSPLLVRVGDKGDAKGKALPAQIVFALYARVPRPGGGTAPARLRLGDYASMTLEQAREKAKAWALLIQGGKDPRAIELAQREAERSAEAARHAHTVKVVSEDFIRRHTSKLAKATDAENTIRRELLGQEKKDGEWVNTKDERWRNRPMAEIKGADVVAIIDGIVDRGAPAQAHNALGYIKRLYSWAIGRQAYGLETSPCDRIKPKDLIGEKVKRDRVLSEPELRAVWKAGETMGYPFGDVIRLLILTGQRKSEVAEAIWSEFDLDKALWTIPAKRMKADAAHVVPLAPSVVALLKDLPRFKHGDHLFTTTGGRRPVSGFSKAKTRADAKALAALRKEAGDEATMEPWVLHDLRRTVRTGFSAIPASDVVRELTIAHTQKGLHRVYDQHSYLDEKRALLEAWAAKVRDIVSPPPDNVTVLRERATA